MTQTISSVKYNLWETRKALTIFYAIYLSIITIMTIFAVILNENNNVTFMGNELSSIIFIFVAGLNSFKSPFRFSLANSISRKTFFKGFLISILPIAGFMAFVETILSFIVARLVPTYQSTFSMYGSRYMEASSMKSLTSDFGFMLESFLWLFTLLCFMILLGFFITTLFYRLSKVLKLIVSFGVPVLLIYVLPAADMFFWHNSLFKNLFSFFKKAVGLNATPQPYMAMLTFSIGSAILITLSYLLIRRATIKQD